MNRKIAKPDSEFLVEKAASEPRLTGLWLRLARLTWLICGVIVILLLLTSLPAYLANLTTNFGHVAGINRAPSAAAFSVLSVLASIASALLSLILSTILFRRRFHEPAAATLSFYLLMYSVIMAGPLEVWSFHWLNDSNLPIMAQTVLLALPTLILLFIFPNGRFIPSWTRFVLLLAVPWNILLLIFITNSSQSLYDFTAAELVMLFLFYISFLVIGLYAQFYRYRNISTIQEKQQTKWVIFGFAIWFAYIAISSVPYFYLTSLPPGSTEPWWGPAAGFGWFLSLNIVPITFTIAITRYHLWDVDLVINRTLLIGGLTFSIISLYVLIVGGASLLLQTQGNWLVVLAATGLVAVLFHPLRQRLQLWANRLVYGQRDEPFEVLNRLGQRLEGTLSPNLIYPTIVETVAQTLKLPYVEIAVVEGKAMATAQSFGKAVSNLEVYPLTHQGEIVGELRVAPRAPNEPFSAADQRLLRSIASQSGTAVHAAQLTSALQHSRCELVTAREEERRRLRRDLHDGLGPQLASQTLGLDAALKLIDNDPHTAKELLRTLRDQSQGGVQDVRRLVYGLRPPALDELGLVGALQESIESYQKQGLNIQLSADRKLPHLSAAVEVAAWRIIQEAVTNVTRHAAAQNCRIRLENQDGWLTISVIDDGRGLPPNSKPGVGLLSMRERAEELNGRMQISNGSEGGTQILVQVPL